MRDKGLISVVVDRVPICPECNGLSVVSRHTDHAVTNWGKFWKVIRYRNTAIRQQIRYQGLLKIDFFFSLKLFISSLLYLIISQLYFPFPFFYFSFILLYFNYYLFSHSHTNFLFVFVFLPLFPLCLLLPFLRSFPFVFHSFFLPFSFFFPFLPFFFQSFIHSFFHFSFFL